MKVGVLRVEFVVPGPASLKEKRRVVKSLKEKLHSRFRVSAAEVDHQDLWQRGALGVAVVGPDGGVVSRVLDEVLRFVRRDPRIEISTHEREIL
jgi:uncharacterized protein YlxP (DUF503 family)